MPESRLQKTREAYRPDDGWSPTPAPGIYTFEHDGVPYTVTIPDTPQDIACQSIDTAKNLTHNGPAS